MIGVVAGNEVDLESLNLDFDNTITLQPNRIEDLISKEALLSIIEKVESIPVIHSFSALKFEEAVDLTVKIENPYFKEIVQPLYNFTVKNDLMLDSYDGTYNMASYLYPDAPKDIMLLLAMVMVVLFFIDDVAGDLAGTEIEGQDALKLMKRVLHSFGEFNSNGHMVEQDTQLGNVMCKLWKILAAYSNPDFMDRLLKTFQNYLVMNVDLDPKHAASVFIYTIYRIFNSGMEPTILFQELALQNFLPKALLNQPAIVEIQKAVAIIGSFTNDICSKMKEGDYLFNIINVLKNTGKLNEAKAIVGAIEIVNENLKKFKQLKIDLLQEYTEEYPVSKSNSKFSIEIYMQGLDSIVRATKLWQLISSRYKDMDHFIKELRIAVEA